MGACGGGQICQEDAAGPVPTPTPTKALNLVPRRPPLETGTAAIDSLHCLHYHSTLIVDASHHPPFSQADGSSSTIRTAAIQLPTATISVSVQLPSASVPAAKVMGDHEHVAIKHHDHILLDQPLVRLPYELLRNNFRSAHFAVEKESAGIKTLLKDAASGCLKGETNQEDLVRNLDDMIAQAKALQRRLSTCADEEARLLHQEGARLKHLDELYAMNSFDDVKYDSWSRTRLDRLVIDFMLRKGCTDSAASLAEARSLQDLVDVDTLVSMNRIRESLRRGSVQEALVWCSQNKKELRKMEVSSPSSGIPPGPVERSFAQTSAL